MTEKIAFIGGGQMARSLIGGLLAGGCAGDSLVVAEPDAERAGALREDFSIKVESSADKIIDGAQAAVLAVKPQVLREVVRDVVFGADCTVVSIAAGIRSDSLRGWLKGNPALVRCMPNTPALVRQGVSALYAPAHTPESARSLAERILGSVGYTCWVNDEDQLDAVTALSGSGPAYYFAFTEALRDAAQTLGLDASTAKLLADKTFTGAAAMAGTGKDVAELRAQVTSKGGTTEAALAQLKARDFTDVIREAMAAAARRSRELGAELSKGEN